MFKKRLSMLKTVEIIYVVRNIGAQQMLQWYVKMIGEKSYICTKIIKLDDEPMNLALI